MTERMTYLLSLLLFVGVIADLSEVITQPSSASEIAVQPMLELIHDKVDPNMQLRFTIPRTSNYMMANFYEWYKLEQGIFCKSGHLLWSLKTSILDAEPLIAGYDKIDDEIVQVQASRIAFLGFDPVVQNPVLTTVLELSSDNSLLMQEYQQWKHVQVHRPNSAKSSTAPASLILVQAGNALTLIEKKSASVQLRSLSGTFSPLNSYFVSEAVSDNFYFFEYNPSSATVCYMNVTVSAWPSANWLGDRVCSALAVDGATPSSFAATYNSSAGRFRLYVINQRQLQYYEIWPGALITMQAPEPFAFEQLWRGDQVWLASSSNSTQVNMLAEAADGSLLVGTWIGSPKVRQISFLSDGSALILSVDGSLEFLNLSLLTPVSANPKIVKYIDASNLAITFDAQFDSITTLLGAMTWATKKVVIAQLGSYQLGVGVAGDYFLPVSCQVLSTANTFSDLNFIQLLSSPDMKTPYAQRIAIRIFSHKFTGLDIGTYFCVGITCVASLLFVLIFFFFVLYGRRSLEYLDAEASF